MTKTTDVQRRTADARLTIKAVGEAGEFEGYGSVFGVKDTYDEIVAQGAFDVSLAEHRAAGTWPAMLWQHNPGEPIGVYTDMREDDKGLYVKGRILADTVRGGDAHKLLKAGALNGLSIGFMPVKTEYDEEEGTATLTEIDLWEVSLVTFPANAESRVQAVKSVDAVKGLETLKDIERHLREAGGFSQKAATAIVGRIKDIDRSQREVGKAMADLKSGAERFLKSLAS